MFAIFNLSTLSALQISTLRSPLTAHCSHRSVVPLGSWACWKYEQHHAIRGDEDVF